MNQQMIKYSIINSVASAFHGNPDFSLSFTVEISAPKDRGLFLFLWTTSASFLDAPLSHTPNVGIEMDGLF